MSILRNRRWLLLLAAVVLFGGGLWLGLAVSAYLGEPNPARYDDTARSTDLPADLKQMWETRPLGGTPDPSHGPNPRSSTDRAINAASRVFNTVDLVGKSRDEVINLLGDPRSSSDTTYNFPFYPAPNSTLVYRFDSGQYGWQFNVLFNEDNGKVREVERHWIE